MSDSLIAQVKRLVEAQKKCWASKWPLERLSDTSLGADTRCMVQVGVTDDGEPIGEVDGGLEPVAEGHKDVLDLLVASLGFDFPALLAELERKDAALKDLAAAWREVAHRSGVKLEAWEDDEYILSAPERGPCGMTIHRRHATVLNAALQPKEPPCQTA